MLVKFCLKFLGCSNALNTPTFGLGSTYRRVLGLTHRIYHAWLAAEKNKSHPNVQTCWTCSLHGCYNQLACHLDGEINNQGPHYG